MTYRRFSDRVEGEVHDEPESDRIDQDPWNVAKERLKLMPAYTKIAFDNATYGREDILEEMQKESSVAITFIEMTMNGIKAFSKLSEEDTETIRERYYMD